MNNSYYSQSSASSSITVRPRPDIVVKEVFYQGEQCWICKDPLDQQYHRLNEQEYAIFRWLDGAVSFEELRDRFELEFTPYRVGLLDLARVIGRFHENSLVYSTDARQGEKLFEMGREKKRDKLKQKFMSVYAIKWKGFDPEVFLNATNPYVSWAFSQKAVLSVMVFTCLSVLWLILHYEMVMQRAPDLWSFLDSSNWLTLGLVLTGTKVFHELGHAYSFKRFGGEVHEIGVMIFFFMPTMYCNTSDSWMLPNKWARIAIALGGVYVELFIFSCATFIWWFSGPGWVESVAINLMFVCSLSAVLINGNPLLKYDGYFVLSDLVEIPNLAKDSTDQLRRQFMVHALGIKDEADPWVSKYNKWFMLIYGVAAYLFRASLMLTVGVIMIQQAMPLGLAPAAYIFSLIITLVYLATPLYQLGKQLKTPGTMIKIKKKNLLITVALVSVLVLLLFIPTPYYVIADCTLDAGEGRTVLTLEPGVLEKKHFRPGDLVSQGDVIVELTNPALMSELSQLREKVSSVRKDIEIRKYDLFTSGSDQPSVQAMRGELDSLKQQQQQLASRCDALTVRAPISGRILGIMGKSENARMNDERSLRTDHGNLLLSEQSTWLKAGMEICRICSQDSCCATVTIRQSDQDIVDNGQAVKMLFHSDRSGIHQSKLTFLSQELELPRNLVDFESEGTTVKSIAQAEEAKSSGEPVNSDGAAMEAAVVLGKCKLKGPASMLFGSTGTAKIYIGPRSVFWRLQRMIRLFTNTKL